MVKISKNSQLVNDLADMKLDVQKIEFFFAYNQLANENDLADLLKTISNVVDKSSILQVEIASYLAQEAFGEKGLSIC